MDTGCSRPALLGCGVLILLLGAASILFLVKADDLFDWAVRQFEAQINEQLPEEISAEERARLEKDLAEANSQIQRLEKLLSSPFAQKAPAHVVDKEREKLAGFQETAEKIKAQLAAL